MAFDPKQAKELFLAALAAPDRAAFLDAQRLDADLRARVDQLLAAHDADPPSPEPLLGTTVAASIGAGEGVVVAGRYTLVSKIGEGGMGEVWYAKQDQPVKRKVAVKLVKAGKDTKAVLARFEQERQALAVMDHPNIAKILDGGLTEAGVPFFVMELVAGVPLTKYCDEGRVGIDERLELFAAICHAVQHAHQKGVIHRDLKPANILVTEIDGKATPKIIDFGVAKSIGGRLTEDTLETQFGAVIGTLEYMAPEQAGLTAVDIDTRADIYALGVILYELLTGVRPIDVRKLKREALDAAIRAIREEEPHKPSTRLSTEDALPSVAAARGTDPKRLAGRLRGDLDWIVMKALEKDRNRRYETANGFAADVRRHLAGEPVLAAPPSSAYKLKKFLRRHRGPVLAANMVLLALVGGVAGTTWGMFQADAARQEEANQRRIADEQRAAAVAQKNRADAEAKAARDALSATNAFATFLSEDILAAGRPEGIQDGLGIETTIAKAIEVAEGKIPIRFKDNPYAEALVRHSIGVTWRNLERFELAERHLRRAVELRLSLGGPQAPETLFSQNSLAVTLLQADRPKEALAVIESALAASLAKGGPDDRRRVALLVTRAEVARDLGRVAEALVLARDVAERAAALGENDQDALRAVHQLGCALIDAGRFAEAVATLDAAWSTARRTHGDTQNETEGLALALAEACHRNGDVAKALALQQHRLATVEQRHGVDSQIALRLRLIIGQRMLEAGRFAEGLAMVEKATKQIRDAHGEKKQLVCDAMAQMARTLALTGRETEALALWIGVAERAKSAHGAAHPHAISALGNLAEAHAKAGDPARAVAVAEQALAGAIGTLGPDHPATLAAKGNLAAFHNANGKHAKALAMTEDLLKRERAVLGERHPNCFVTMSNLGGLLGRCGREAEGLASIEAALAGLQSTLGRNHLKTLQVQRGLGEKLRDVGRVQAAIATLRDVFAAEKAVLGPDHPETAKSADSLGGALMDAEQFAEAAPLIESALRSLRLRFGPDHPETMRVTHNLAALWWHEGRTDKSIPLFEEALASESRKLGPQHTSTLFTKANLGTNYLSVGRTADAIAALEDVEKRRGDDRELRCWTANVLASAYLAAGRTADAARTATAVVVESRATFPKGSRDLAEELAKAADTLAHCGAFAEAEPILRECLAIRVRLSRGPDPQVSPADLAFTRAWLGEALAGQGKFPEAEPLLRDGHQGMVDHPAPGPPQRVAQRLAEVASALVQLYEKTGRAAEAAKWRKIADGHRAKLPPLVPPPAAKAKAP